MREAGPEGGAGPEWGRGCRAVFSVKGHRCLRSSTKRRESSSFPTRPPWRLLLSSPSQPKGPKCGERGCLVTRNHTLSAPPPPHPSHRETPEASPPGAEPGTQGWRGLRKCWISEREEGVGTEPAVAKPGLEEGLTGQAAWEPARPQSPRWPRSPGAGHCFPSAAWALWRSTRNGLWRAAAARLSRSCLQAARPPRWPRGAGRHPQASALGLTPDRHADETDSL